MGGGVEIDHAVRTEAHSNPARPERRRGTPRIRSPSGGAPYGSVAGEGDSPPAPPCLLQLRCELEVLFGKLLPRFARSALLAFSALSEQRAASAR